METETVMNEARALVRRDFASPPPTRRPALGALTRKLAMFGPLDADAKRALDALGARAVRRFSSREDIITEGSRSEGLRLIVEGHACRYKVLPDGRRQITAILIPGDLCDLRLFVRGDMDHAVATLTPATVAELSRDVVIDLTERHPRIARALWWSSLVDDAISHEWIVNIGRRTALESMSHLLCELFTRLRAVGLATDRGCELPLSQVELADTLGLSVVHVNRVLQELRGVGLITLKGRALVIHDFNGLADIAMFNPGYLHLESRA